MGGSPLICRRLLSESLTRRSGSLYGSGSRITASRTLKIVTLAPIPSAAVSMMANVNPGYFRNMRAAYRKSCDAAPKSSEIRFMIPSTELWAILFHELLVSSLLDQASVLQYQDAINHRVT